MPKEKQKIICPNCNSKNIIKKGIRKNKLQIIQKYQCKDCKKYFTIQDIKHKTYPLKIILKAISLYNLGYTLDKTKDIINKRHNLSITSPTILAWLNQYKPICTFSRLRKQAKKLYKPQNIIFKKQLQHKQIYKFQLHKAKIELLSKELQPQKFSLLKSYLQKIPAKSFPHHIFQPNQEEELEGLSRSSQMKFETLKFIKIEKHNSANALALLGLQLAKTNKQRHEVIQNFMLINDSTTIATEIPVYLTKDDIKYFKDRRFTLNIEKSKTPITGHIDILQIRNGLIHILDYKPEAHKKALQEKAIQQLTIYALALASRTKLAIKDFKCAFFNENNYYEFFPLHAVYPKH